MFFVRTASESDLPIVREILVETYHATYDEIVGVEQVNDICQEFQTLGFLEKRRHAPNSEFLVADNGTIIGGMAYASQTDKTIMLHQLYVHPKYHGGKTGLHLLIEIENSFLDAETIKLEVAQGNEKAIRFYEKYGFKHTGEVQDHCGGMSGVTSLVMEKSVIYAED